MDRDSDAMRPTARITRRRRYAGSEAEVYSSANVGIGSYRRTSREGSGKAGC